jgi:hypothetical protein
MNRFLQTLLALSGMIISGLLGYQTLDSQAQQQEQEEIALFTQQLNFAMSQCDPSLLMLPADIAERLEDDLYRDYLTVVSDKLKECETGGAVAVAPAPAAPIPTDIETPASEEAAPSPSIVRAPITRGDTAIDDKKIVASRAPIRPFQQASRNIDLRMSEGLQRSVQAAPGEWHAVLASYRAASEANVALEHFAELQKRVAGNDPAPQLAIYRTAQSDHYAIVIVPGATRERANNWVERARKEGWARDAFAQDNRNWKKCEDPLATRLRGC